ncbi:CHASE4 domain-containing protein [Enterobacter kobei]|uniref:CHASE4 domain-containing protein n=1 Tax=Enterobacter kobei TaxID=208224 RepID=UPI00388D0C11
MTLPLTTPGFTDAEHSKRLINKTFTYVVTLLIAIFAAAIISLLIIKNNVNEISDSHDDFLLRKALDTRQESIRSHLKDYAEWGDAYKHLHQNVDMHWAWDKQNLGKSLYDNFGYEGVFVLSPEGATRYSVISGKRIPEDLERWLGQSTKDRLLIELSKKKGLPVSMLTLIDGIPAIVSAEWITTGDDSSVQPLPGRPSVMVFVDKLTAKKLLAIGHDAAIKNVRISPNEVNNQTSLTIREVAIKWSAAPDMTPQTVLYRRPVAQFSNFQPKIVSSWLILALFQANFLISGRSRLCPYQLVNSNQVRQGE